jgi:hypothetical protein
LAATHRVRHRLVRGLAHLGSSAALNRLVELGLVEPRGERKDRTWHLPAATGRRLGQPAAYFLRRG